jgi:hypothetical protein
MGVSGQHHAPAALYPRAPGTHCTGGWVGPRAGLDAEARRKILCPCRGSNPGLVRSQTLYCLSYRGSYLVKYQPKNCLHGSAGSSTNKVTSHGPGCWDESWQGQGFSSTPVYPVRSGQTSLRCNEHRGVREVGHVPLSSLQC